MTMDFIFRTDNSNAKFYGRHFSTKTSKKPVASATPMQTWDRNIQFTNPPKLNTLKSEMLRRLPFWRRRTIRRCLRRSRDRWRTRLSRGRRGSNNWRPPRGPRRISKTTPVATQLSCPSKSFFRVLNCISGNSFFLLRSQMVHVYKMILSSVNEQTEHD